MIIKKSNIWESNKLNANLEYIFDFADFCSPQLSHYVDSIKIPTLASFIKSA